MKRRVPGWMAGGFCVVDVDDVAEAHLLAEQKGRVGDRYILGGHNVTYRDFYQLVCEVAGVRPPPRELPGWAVLGMGRLAELWSDHYSHKAPPLTYKAVRTGLLSMHYDNAKARTELGMRVTPLRTTVEKSVNWFRQHGYA
jgi:dihydroflavonol-4-reductase